MLRSFHAECQKAHRRHDLAACLLIPIAILVWSSYAAPNGTDELQVAYHALFYSLPIMNTVLMPVGMAMLASRLWDVEVKGNSPKLLYALQSRQSLFAAKAALGTLEVLLIVTLEIGGALVLGTIERYTDTPTLGQLLYYFVCTCTVNLMLFFLELLLTILLSNPLPALCTGIAGALVGLFTAFMPPLLSYFVPWSYFIPLGTYILADWNPDTRVVIYDIRPFQYPLLIWSGILGIFFLIFTWHAIQKKEV